MLTKVQGVLSSAAHFQTQKLSIVTANVRAFLKVECSEVILRLTLCSAFFCLNKFCIVYSALFSF